MISRCKVCRQKSSSNVKCRAGIKNYDTGDDEVILETGILWGSNAQVGESVRANCSHGRAFSTGDDSTITLHNYTSTKFKLRFASLSLSDYHCSSTLASLSRSECFASTCPSRSQTSSSRSVRSSAREMRTAQASSNQSRLLRRSRSCPSL